jgi:hypothetical protein
MGMTTTPHYLTYHKNILGSQVRELGTQNPKTLTPACLCGTPHATIHVLGLDD